MNDNFNKISSILDKAGVFYLATVEVDQPRVRPFGAYLIHDDKFYLITGKVKEVSKQLTTNPKAELCAFDGDKWIRIAGNLINDDSREVKTLMLDKVPSLRAMYNEDDGNMQMLYFKDATVTISSFVDKPEQFNI